MPGRWQCLNDHPASDDDTVCAQCGADVVWQREQLAGPVATPARQQTAWGWIIAGFVFAVIGAAVVVGLSDEEDAGVPVLAGYLAAAFGTTLTSIGIVAEGVRIGRNLSR